MEISCADIRGEMHVVPSFSEYACVCKREKELRGTPPASLKCYIHWAMQDQIQAQTQGPAITSLPVEGQYKACLANGRQSMIVL